MKLAVILIAIGAMLMLEPRPVYLDGVAPRVIRYERVDWKPRPLTPSEAMLIGAPRTSGTVVWP